MNTTTLQLIESDPRWQDARSLVRHVSNFCSDSTQLPTDRNLRRQIQAAAASAFINIEAMAVREEHQDVAKLATGVCGQLLLLQRLLCVALEYNIIGDSEFAALVSRIVTLSRTLSEQEVARVGVC